VVGRRFGAFVTQPSSARFNAFLAEALAAEGEGRRGRACELALQQEPSGTVHVRVSAATLDGPASTALLAVEDETGRRRAEEALREEGRQKDEFLATLSHELRNPLAPIRNGLFVLDREPGGAQGRRALETIDRQVAHLTHLVDDLLDVTPSPAERSGSPGSGWSSASSCGRRWTTTALPSRRPPSPCGPSSERSRAGWTPTPPGWRRSWGTCSGTPPSSPPAAAR
jgi:PAS domain-containing protein